MGGVVKLYVHVHFMSTYIGAPDVADQLILAFGLGSTGQQIDAAGPYSNSTIPFR